MPKNRMNKNLFSIQTPKGKLLYRLEGEGYCFYSTKVMRFYFLDKITGIFLLQSLKVIDQKQVKIKIRKILGYSIKGIYSEIRKHYFSLIPKELAGA